MRQVRLTATTLAACLIGLVAPTKADFIYYDGGAGATPGTRTIKTYDTVSGATGTFVESSLLRFPGQLAFDPAGNLYVANTFDIVKFTPSGAGSVFATFDAPNSASTLAVDAGGNLYVSNDYTAGNGYQILKFNPGGQGSTFATTPDGAASLAIDPGGNLYLSQGDQGQITKITPGGSTSVFAKSVALDGAHSMAFGPDGNLFVASLANDTIQEVTPGGVVSQFAKLNFQPGGLAFDSAGNLFVNSVSTRGDLFKIATAGTVTDTGVSTGAVYSLAVSPLTSAVPEPSSLTLAVSGALTALGFALCKRSRATPAASPNPSR